MSLITETIRTFLPNPQKRTQSGWISFNAVCCPHNGTSLDTRSRGGVNFSADDHVSYHCFNCGFKASWQPGRKMSKELKKLLQWLGTPDDIITKCAFEALKTKDEFERLPAKKLLPEFFERLLPLNSIKLIDALLAPQPDPHAVAVLEYLDSRRLSIDDYDWYWSPELSLRNRLIIPFYYRSRLVGYTARSVVPTKQRYLSEQQPSFVFNLDSITRDQKYIFVLEGPLDAICINAVALTGSVIGPGQAMLLESYSQPKVLVPDCDKASIKLIEQALELGWLVSFPDWPVGINDVNDAIKKLGKLTTLYKIAANICDTPLKIQLGLKRWERLIEENNKEKECQ